VLLLEDKLVAYGSRNSSLSSSNSYQNACISPQYVKSKILKAVLDIAILNEMTYRNAISVPNTIEVFMKKHFVYVSSGTIYPVFERLEKQGYIVKLPLNRFTRLYSISVTGRNMLENVQQNIDDLEYFLMELVKTKGER
jgi:DNA-binding PadR family transcriptional regulator